jgi:hypothetical protein
LIVTVAVRAASLGGAGSSNVNGLAKHPGKYRKNPTVASTVMLVKSLMLLCNPAAKDI